MHDGFKYGKKKEQYTRFDHPLIASEVIMKNQNKLIMNINDLRKLCMMIESHMGKYNKDYNGNEVLPLPRNEMERFLNRCDYLASRKFLNIEFNNDLIVEGEMK